MFTRQMLVGGALVLLLGVFADAATISNSAKIGAPAADGGEQLVRELSRLETRMARTASSLDAHMRYNARIQKTAAEQYASEILVGTEPCHAVFQHRLGGTIQEKTNVIEMFIYGDAAQCTEYKKSLEKLYEGTIHYIDRKRKDENCDAQCVKMKAKKSSGLFPTTPWSVTDCKDC